MFIWRADTILDQFAQHLPEVSKAFAGLDAKSPPSAIAHAFAQCPSVSIDYGIMERAENVVVVPGTFGWNDVGDWRAVHELTPKNADGNALEGNVVVHESSNCLVQAKDRLVVLVGMKDMIVIETDDALLICHQNATQEIKTIQKQLAQQKPDYT